MGETVQESRHAFSCLVLVLMLIERYGEAGIGIGIKKGTQRFGKRIML